jgi:hypothetical protein
MFWRREESFDPVWNQAIIDQSVAYLLIAPTALLALSGAYSARLAIMHRYLLSQLQ